MKIASFDIGIINLAFCKVSYDSQKITNNFTIHEWKLIDVLENNSKNADIYTLAYLIITKLNTFNFSDCDEIILEQQPNLNSRMEKVSMIILNYFIMKNIMNNEKKIIVKFVSAKNKLNVYDGPFIECNLKLPYTRNKFYAKKYTEYIIKNDHKWSNFFNSFKKKDDLADCFLQGAWYLMSKDNKKYKS